MKELPQVKIALVGTTTVGKTAIMNSFRVQYEGSQFGFVPEVASKFWSIHPEPEWRRGWKAQLFIQQMQFSEEILNSLGHEIIICDRSVIDAPVYVYSGGRTHAAKYLLDRVRYWLPSYSVFLLLDPQGVPYVPSGVKTETSEERLKIHQSFIEFFKLFQIPHALISGTIDERVSQIKKIINLAKSSVDYLPAST